MDTNALRADADNPPANFLLGDQHAFFGKLRETGPIHRLTFPDGIDRWVVTRYDEVASVLSDPRFSNGNMMQAAAVEGLEPEVRETLAMVDSILGQAMPSQDPPSHTRLRKLVVGAFSAKRMDALRPRIQEMTNSRLDAMVAAAADDLEGTVDLVHHLAYPLPVAVICELLGVPEPDRASFHSWSSTLTAFLLDITAAARALEAMKAMRSYLLDLIAAKRRRPDDGLLTVLIAAHEDEQRLSDVELVAFGIMLLVAGHENTTHLISSGALNLLRNPSQLAMIREQPELLRSAIDELLRYDGPLNPGLPRFTLEDVQISGVTIPKHSLVMVGLAPANRDPRRFPDADRLDITRQSKQHLAYGHGIHRCLGARLAQIEGEIALGTLIRRFPQLHLAVPADSLKCRFGFIRSLVEMPVRLA